MIYWIEFENLPGKRHPKWFRTLGLTKDLNVLVPIEAFTNMPDTASIMASEDGVLRYRQDGHIYIPAVWAMGMFPKYAEIGTEMIKGAYKHREDNHAEIYDFFKEAESKK